MASVLSSVEYTHTSQCQNTDTELAIDLSTKKHFNLRSLIEDSDIQTKPWLSLYDNDTTVILKPIEEPKPQMRTKTTFSSTPTRKDRYMTPDTFIKRQNRAEDTDSLLISPNNKPTFNWSAEPSVYGYFEISNVNISKMKEGLGSNFIIFLYVGNPDPISDLLRIEYDNNKIRMFTGQRETTQILMPYYTHSDVTKLYSYVAKFDEIDENKQGVLLPLFCGNQIIHTKDCTAQISYEPFSYSFPIDPTPSNSNRYLKFDVKFTDCQSNQNKVGILPNDILSPSRIMSLYDIKLSFCKKVQDQHKSCHIEFIVRDESNNLKTVHRGVTKIDKFINFCEVINFDTELIGFPTIVVKVYSVNNTRSKPLFTFSKRLGEFKGKATLSIDSTKSFFKSGDSLNNSISFSYKLPFIFYCTNPKAISLTTKADQDVAPILVLHSLESDDFDFFKIINANSNKVNMDLVYDYICFDKNISCRFIAFMARCCKDGLAISDAALRLCLKSYIIANDSSLYDDLLHVIVSSFNAKATDVLLCLPNDSILHLVSTLKNDLFKRLEYFTIVFSNPRLFKLISVSRLAPTHIGSPYSRFTSNFISTVYKSLELNTNEAKQHVSDCLSSLSYLLEGYANPGNVAYLLCPLLSVIFTFSDLLELRHFSSIILSLMKYSDDNQISNNFSMLTNDNQIRFVKFIDCLVIEIFDSRDQIYCEEAVKRICQFLRKIEGDLEKSESTFSAINQLFVNLLTKNESLDGYLSIFTSLYRILSFLQPSTEIITILVFYINYNIPQACNGAIASIKKLMEHSFEPIIEVINFEIAKSILNGTYTNPSSLSQFRPLFKELNTSNIQNPYSKLLAIISKIDKEKTGIYKAIIQKVVEINEQENDILSAFITRWKHIYCVDDLKESVRLCFKARLFHIIEKVASPLIGLLTENNEFKSLQRISEVILNGYSQLLKNDALPISFFKTTINKKDAIVVYQPGEILNVKARLEEYTKTKLSLVDVKCAKENAKTLSCSEFYLYEFDFTAGWDTVYARRLTYITEAPLPYMKTFEFVRYQSYTNIDKKTFCILKLSRMYGKIHDEKLRLLAVTPPNKMIEDWKKIIGYVDLTKMIKWISKIIKGQQPHYKVVYDVVVRNQQAPMEVINFSHVIWNAMKEGLWAVGFLIDLVDCPLRDEAFVLWNILNSAK